MGADASVNTTQGFELLSLLQLSDSAFPTGAFSHSQGMEAFYAAAELEDAEDLTRLVSVQLSALATSDCVALRTAHASEGAERAARADRLLTATKLSRELRQASISVGKRFLKSVSALEIRGRVEEFEEFIREERTDGNHAVCYGIACSELGLSAEDALHSYLYTSAASLVAAGQKLIPLGGSAAQRVLYATAPQIRSAADISEGLDPEEMYAFTPVLDVRSMCHERQRVRLYIS